MARPRVFVSSTYYDLKHLRSALENFIDSLGYEPVLSEKGSIPYAPDIALDESCYREAAQADIMVLIVGGRYGSERSGEAKRDPKIDAHYDSITKLEFEAAVKGDVPLYILMERAVYAEYQTYLKNRDISGITYAHVDSVNIFKMIEIILALPRNNPVFTFERFQEIEAWLIEQWAGLFRELLRRTSNQQQLKALGTQIEILTETNITLKKYLESVIQHVAPTESVAIIEKEIQRLSTADDERRVRGSDLGQTIERETGISAAQIAHMVRAASSVTAFLDMARSYAEANGKDSTILKYWISCISGADTLVDMGVTNAFKELKWHLSLVSTEKEPRENPSPNATATPRKKRSE